MDWLLAYAADEQYFRGVDCSDPVECEKTESANCSAVAGLRLTWDFDAKAWHAKFVDGSLKGAEKYFAMQSITVHHWQKMKDTFDGCDGYFGRASSLQRKHAAKHLLTLWCEAIARDEGHAFEAEWLLEDDLPLFETPAKKRRTDRVADDDDADSFEEDAATAAVADGGEADDDADDAGAADDA